MKIKIRDIKPSKPKPQHTCNYAENYYGDQVCIQKSKQEK